MCDCNNVPGPTARACHERRSLAQRALACEITGDLDRAMTLIRCLQRSGAGGYPAAPRSTAGGERRID
jgi:hypothetical protein